MSSFRIIPISKEYAQKIRLGRYDDFGHEIVEQLATGKGPCRVSLQPFRKGLDKRLLFSYSPFQLDNAYHQPGPVFIQAQEVEPYSDLHRFPPLIKADPKSFPLTLIGYNVDQMMVLTKLVGSRDVDELILEIFESQEEVSYLHARNAEAGCYICQIERA